MRRFLLLPLLLVLFQPLQATAKPIIQVPFVYVFPDETSATFDVYVGNPDPDPITIKSFSFGLSFGNNSLNPLGPLEFTAADFPGNYIFEGNSFNQFFTLPLSPDPFPNTDFVANDEHIDPFESITIQPQKTKALGRVTVSIPAGADHFSNTPLELDPFTTALIDGDDNLLIGFLGDIELVDGRLSVLPEPSSLLLFASAGIAGLLFWLRRR